VIPSLVTLHQHHLLNFQMIGLISVICKLVCICGTIYNSYFELPIRGELDQRRGYCNCLRPTKGSNSVAWVECCSRYTVSFARSTPMGTVYSSHFHHLRVWLSGLGEVLQQVHYIVCQKHSNGYSVFRLYVWYFVLPTQSLVLFCR
jgi:hypothetical protein